MRLRRRREREGPVDDRRDPPRLEERPDLAQEALGEGHVPTGPHQRLVESRPGYKDFGDRKMLASSAHMYAAMLQTITAAEGVDRLPDLGGIAVPTLVLVGEEDAPFRKPSQRMADAIPGATVHPAPIDHGGCVMEAELFLPALVGAVRDVVARAGALSPS